MRVTNPRSRGEPAPTDTLNAAVGARFARDQCPGIVRSVEPGQPPLSPQALHLAQDPGLPFPNVRGRRIYPQLLRIGQDRGQQRGLGVVQP